jgi:hypothetical protein
MRKPDDPSAASGAEKPHPGLLSRPQCGATPLKLERGKAVGGGG